MMGLGLAYMPLYLKTDPEKDPEFSHYLLSHVLAEVYTLRVLL